MALIPMKLLSLTYRFSFEMRGFRFIGVIPLLIGVAILFWCWKEFIFKGKGTPAPYHPPKELVLTGLYRFTRNPMYVGVIFVLFGETLLFESTLLLIYAGVIFFMFHIWIIIFEEPRLRSAFGEVYKRYCKTVPRWFIRLK